MFHTLQRFENPIHLTKSVNKNRYNFILKKPLKMLNIKLSWKDLRINQNQQC